MISRLIICAAFVVVTASDTRASIYFSEDFTSTPNPASVIAPDGGYSFAGVARRTNSNDNDNRYYVQTVATNYNAVDFVADLTFTLTNTGNGSSNILFFGLGSASPDGAYHNEPSNSLYFRIHA